MKSAHFLSDFLEENIIIFELDQKEWVSQKCKEMTFNVLKSFENVKCPWASQKFFPPAPKGGQTRPQNTTLFKKSVKQKSARYLSKY